MEEKDGGCHHPNCDCGYNLDKLGAKIDRTLNRQGLLSATQKTKLRTDLAVKAKQQDWHARRTTIENKINEIAPNLGLFIERHWFENDELYRTYPMHAIFFAGERLSPWYYQPEELVRWVEPNKYVLRSYVHLKNHLYAQRPQIESLMRKAPE